MNVMNIELIPYYQNIVSLQDDEVFGYEALIRGKTDGQYMMPSVLFKQAKFARVIPEFDIKARQVSICKAQKFIGDTKLFLNCHPYTLNYEYLMRQFDPSVPLHQIVLEITEQERVESYAKIKPTICALQKQGMMLAIDDFGSGYANHSFISLLKPDFVKLALELVQNALEFKYERELILSLVSFARKMGIKTIAEGIETEEQMNLMKELGVDYGQGFHFGMPFAFFRKPPEKLRNVE